MTRLEWSRTHGDPWLSADPPDGCAIPVPGAAGGGSAAGAQHNDPTPVQETAWDSLAGQGKLLTELRELLDQLEADPMLRAAARLQALSRARAELLRVPDQAQMSDPVCLQLKDAAVLVHMALGKLR